MDPELGDPMSLVLVPEEWIVGEGVLVFLFLIGD